ncbi:hypothetical protein C8Q72DRAFT_861574 [Fomitopsis betulina]|nr:hypothetical protein C8Q72DRAFT_861574 [Fomitopsis betulina]
MSNPYTNAPPVRSSKSLGGKDPLYGWLPRHIKSEQVLKAMAGDVNPFTKQSHSAQYKKILESRKKLPVFAQMGEFLKMRNITDVYARKV